MVSSLFDYATRELGYREAAASRRIKAMRLCGEVEGARERMQDGSLTLNAAALLQNAFDRQERKRKQSGGGHGARAGAGSTVAPNGSAVPGAPSSVSSAPAQAGERAEEPNAGPVLDSSARQALVEEAAGKSTRQVENLLAGVDPALTVPADRIRPPGAGRTEWHRQRRQHEEVSERSATNTPWWRTARMVARVAATPCPLGRVAALRAEQRASALVSEPLEPVPRPTKRRCLATDAEWEAHACTPLASSGDLWFYLRMAHAQFDGLMPDGQEAADLPDSETPTKDTVPAVEPPQPYDPHWRERIERARSAWEDGRKARQGKPIVFSIEDPRPLT